MVRGCLLRSFVWLVLTFSVLLSTVRGEIAEAGNSQQHGAPKVKVTVYFGSLCPDSRDFFAEQLAPTYSKLGDIMRLNFVPFGKAVATPKVREGRVLIDFQCQHGPRECLANRLLSCAQDAFEPTVQFEVFRCILADRNPATAGEQCAISLGLEWTPVSECASRHLGSVLLYMNGRRTARLRPHLYFVPTVTINGVYSRSSLQRSVRDLLGQVCEAYGAPHPHCGKATLS